MLSVSSENVSVAIRSRVLYETASISEPIRAHAAHTKNDAPAFCRDRKLHASHAPAATTAPQISKGVITAIHSPKPKSGLKT